MARAENLHLQQHRIVWAQLLKRVFDEPWKSPPGDVEVKSQKCGGVLRLEVFVAERNSVKRFLDGVGWSGTAPTILSMAGASAPWSRLISRLLCCPRPSAHLN